MRSVLLFAALVAGFLGLRSLFRRARPRARSIFRDHGLFAGRLTEGLLHALIADHGRMRGDTRISAVEGSSIVIDREGACGRLILSPALGFGREDDLPGLSLLARRHAPGRSTTLVVLGGSEAFGQEAFEATSPLRTIHVDDDGHVREARAGFRSSAPRLVVENALDRMAEDLGEGAFPSLDFETARDLVGSLFPADRHPRLAFHPVVTTALTAAIVLCFMVELFISRDAFRGDGATLSIVYRMGAIHQASVFAGEWQRLLAAPFLHFGLLHLGVNGWAQWSLGAPIEFLIGPWRFLALWLGSALGASLTSLWFNESSVSAGASGAIFGLLGAFTTFVFFRKDVLPQPVPRALRNGVLATLLLNLMISFVPSIDMAAHAGGFVTGALLVVPLLKGRRETPSTSARSVLLRLSVALLVLLGVGVTSIQQRADLTVIPPVGTTDHAVQDLKLPIPSGFEVSENRAQGLTVVDAGQGPASPYSVTYRVSERQADEAAALRILRRFQPEDAEPPGSDWIALSRMGIRNLRAIEVVVVAPASCRTQAEELGSRLADGIR